MAEKRTAEEWATLTEQKKVVFVTCPACHHKQTLDISARITDLEKRCDQAVAAFHDASRLRSMIQKARIKAEKECDKLRAALQEILTAAPSCDNCQAEAGTETVHEFDGAKSQLWCLTCVEERKPWGDMATDLGFALRKAKEILDE